MNTQEALAYIGVTSESLSAEQRRALDDDGFFIVENYYSAAQLEPVKDAIDALQAMEGEHGGHEVHTETGAPRLSNVLNKSVDFDIFLACKPLLAAACHALGEIKVHGFNSRDALRGQGHQQLHTDCPKIERGDPFQVVNSLILIDAFTSENGATRVVPGTHHRIERPQDTLPDPTAPYPGESIVTAPAGSVVVINAHTWHGGTLNVSGDRRRVLHLSYTRRELPQQLAQRDYLTPRLYGRISEPHRFLLDIH